MAAGRMSQVIQPHFAGHFSLLELAADVRSHVGALRLWNLSSRCSRDAERAGPGCQQRPPSG